jgi:hypothetical protein
MTQNIALTVTWGTSFPQQLRLSERFEHFFWTHPVFRPSKLLPHDSKDHLDWDPRNRNKWEKAMGRTENSGAPRKETECRRWLNPGLVQGSTLVVECLSTRALLNQCWDDISNREETNWEMSRDHFITKDTYHCIAVDFWRFKWVFIRNFNRKTKLPTRIQSYWR